MWSVSIEYRTTGGQTPWECWDHLEFRTRELARKFAAKMLARKKMAGRMVRRIHIRDS